MPDQPDFFISYSNKDIQFVSQLHNDLEKLGFKLWRDKTHIRATDYWPEVIHSALISCKAMILILSNASMNSVQVKREWFFYLDHARPLICLWLEDCDVHFQLGLNQRIDFRQTSAYDESLQLLAHELRLLLQTQSAAPESQPVQPYNVVSWESIATTASYYTETTLGVRYREKYASEYYLQRPEIFKHFQDFLDSDKTIMTLTGRAGMGKSSFICSLNTSLPPNDLVWLQDCAHLDLDEDTSIDEYISNLFHFPEGAIATFTALYAQDPSYRIILLFDAINEYAERDLLMEKLSEFTRLIHTPAIKVFITCRLPIWNKLKRLLTVPVDREYHPAGPNSYVSLDAFSKHEAKQVYDLYRKKYHLQSSYTELSEQVRYFLAQPLFLKLTAEAYEDKKLPGTLVLQEVFTAYVTHSLGAEGVKSVEYMVLRRATELMYEYTQREIKVALLKQDPQLARDIEFQSYRHLLEEGVLSERGENESLLIKTEMVFVTYERVFEFLLAAFVLGTITVNNVIQHLDFARAHSFPQFRGALELALGFTINKKSDSDGIIELARLDRPDSRQFLSDVIRLIYDTGRHDIAVDIVTRLSEDDNQYCNLLAVQTAYQLHLDEQLISMAYSDSNTLRDPASIYIYQRWNKARLEGNLDDAYKIVNTMVESIKLNNPRKAVKALSALLSLSVNLVSHLVDDPVSLYPLGQVFQQIVRKIPGLERRPDQNALVRLASDVTLSIVTRAFTYAQNNAIREGPLSDSNSMAEFYGDPKNGRALVDSAPFWDMQSLVGQEDKLERLLKWKHVLPVLQIRGPMMYHTYKDVETHLPIVEDLYSRVKGNKDHMVGLIQSNGALIYAMVCRAVRHEVIPEWVMERIYANTSDLWYSLDEFDSTTHITGALEGIFFIEASLQKSEGNIQGSAFLVDLVADIGRDIKPIHVEQFLKSLERAAYQGYAEFVIVSVLNDKFRKVWDSKAHQAGIQTLANLRSFYQDEVDSAILASEDDMDKTLWDEVRTQGSMPAMNDVFAPSFNLMTVATSLVPVILKIGGVAIAYVAMSKSFAQSNDRLVKALLAGLFDYDEINICFLTWFKLHNPDWDNFEKFEVPHHLSDPSVKPEIHEYAQKIIGDYIKWQGRGIMYGEL